MQRITLLCVGKLKEKFWQEAVAEYVKRLSGYCKLEIVELPEEKLPKSPSSGQIQAALAKEAGLIRSKIPAGAYTVALCIEGKERSSEELASMLQAQTMQADPKVAFLIGGSYGLDAGLKRECRERLSMSPMTFPHHLARVMLLEQVYRAYKIQEGSEYHK